MLQVVATGAIAWTLAAAALHPMDHAESAAALTGNAPTGPTIYIYAKTANMHLLKKG